VSPKQPRVTAGEVLHALGRAGWYVDHRKGSHVFLRHGDRPGMRVTVATHAGDVVAPKTLQSILEQAGLSADELRRLL
jgi:predicted RNA binding protein YcfA (HicA-like mRNA interferase family)